MLHPGRCARINIPRPIGSPPVAGYNPPHGQPRGVKNEVRTMISRRAILVTPLALAAARASAAASGKMTLAIHQNTSAGAGYRKSLEGWSRAGIKNVELTAALLDEFLKTDSLNAARSVLSDNGLTPVS